ncbi:MAG: MFS transporter, partial [Eubacterium sp.]
ATGLIATIGYTPDLFLPIISGKMLDSMDQIIAFKYIIIILVGFGVFSILMSLIMLRFIKKNKQKKEASCEV